jgi:hypothetical protein
MFGGWAGKSLGTAGRLRLWESFVSGWLAPLALLAPSSATLLQPASGTYQATRAGPPASRAALVALVVLLGFLGTRASSAAVSNRSAIFRAPAHPSPARPHSPLYTPAHYLRHPDVTTAELTAEGDGTTRLGTRTTTYLLFLLDLLLLLLLLLSY